MPDLSGAGTIPRPESGREPGAVKPLPPASPLSSPMTNPRRVVAILPAYNLEKTIGDVVERTKAFVDAVIVPADASRDGTAAAARKAGAVVPEPEMVRGKGYAILKGIAAAKELEPAIVILMDSDGQHLPEEIPTMLAPLQEGRADLVSGSRMLGTLRTSAVNVFGNRFLRMLSFVLTWRWLTDTETGFRAFRAEVLFDMPLRSRGYEIESELMIRSLCRRLRIVEVPITVPFAVPGVTVWDGFKIAWFKIKLALRLRLGLEAA